MSELEESLETAFVDAGFEIGEISRNRKQVRIEVPEDDASASALRDIVTDTLGEDKVLGLDVTTESVEGDEIATVVTFRYRE